MKDILIEFTGTIKELPKKGSLNAAGYDLKADIQHSYELSKDLFPIEYSVRYGIVYVVLPPGKTLLIQTGFKMQIPQGYEAEVRPRSGMALKHQITVGNSPGTIDSDYRGEVGVILINHSDKPFTITQGDRIAQMVIKEIPYVNLMEGKIDDTERGTKGFGSTGK